MTIRLTISNLDALPDGGPTSFQAKHRSFEIGREQHLDWTLPDPGRYISGRHCEVRFENGAYNLHDTSTNGVFVNGATQRAKSPYQLRNGDRLAIGHYIIDVSLPSDEPAGDAPERRPSASVEDIWSIGSPVPAPMGRREFMSSGKRERKADFSEDFLEFPEIREPAPKQAASGASVWDAPDAPSAPASAISSRSVAGPAAGRAAAPEQERPAALPSTPIAVEPVVARPIPAPPAQPAPSVRVQPAAHVHAAPPSLPVGHQAGGASFLTAFATGAGISAAALQNRNPDELAAEIGQFVRIAVENLRQLLMARAAAKTMTKSVSRTMIGVTDNNPLKFIPADADAIEVMFARNRPGYQDATRSLAEAFGDLKRHDLSTYSAMQKALAKLLGELAPDSIEAKAGGSAFRLKKGRAWDAYVAKWAEREASENGMLDAFLTYFAEAYDEANSRK